MKKRKKRAKKGELQTITKAVTHIRLEVANKGKLATLDQVAEAFLALAQCYVTIFCTDELPDSFRAPCFPTPLSERWHRVAIQQAAGIARSWRTNRATAYQDYLDEVAEYQEQQADGTLQEGTKEPEFREWNIPTLRESCIQANCNVVKLEEADQESGTFDYWLRISTLDKGKRLLVPLKLAAYHKEQLTDPQTGKRRTINSSVTLNKRDGVWWVTLSYDEIVAVPSELHEGCQFAYEQLSVVSMRYKARSMNAYMRASNLGHIPNQIAWNATKRGVAATKVKSAYSSQECHVCHYVDRKNRPNQGTFHCRVCGHTTHADKDAARNIASRLGDLELRACQNQQEVKALLLRRHEQCKQNASLVIVQAPAQLSLWNHLTGDPGTLQRA